MANNPHAFSHFHENGPPYRAKLFKLARTTYWIVYTIDDEARTVDFLRFWNSAREPGTHGL
jgi:mRNA-degrading endonuclease RelE of RelBE toxin-antitoxin system